DVSQLVRAEQVGMKLKLREMPARTELEEEIARTTDRTQLERLERALARRELVGDGTEGAFWLTIWRLGEAFLVSTPGEPYASCQMSLRRQFPQPTIAVMNATDGCLNYLPPRDAYRRDVYQVRAALFDAGSLEKVTEVAAQTIGRMG